MSTIAPERTLRAGCAPALPAQKLLTFLRAALGAHTRLQAVLVATRRGLLDL